MTSTQPMAPVVADLATPRKKMKEFTNEQCLNVVSMLLGCYQDGQLQCSLIKHSRPPTISFLNHRLPNSVGPWEGLELGWATLYC